MFKDLLFCTAGSCPPLNIWGVGEREGWTTANCHVCYLGCLSVKQSKTSTAIFCPPGVQPLPCGVLSRGWAKSSVMKGDKCLTSLSLADVLKNSEANKEPAVFTLQARTSHIVVTWLSNRQQPVRKESVRWWALSRAQTEHAWRDFFLGLCCVVVFSSSPEEL